MSGSRFFSWKEQPLKRIGVKNDTSLHDLAMILPKEKFEIECYETRIKNDPYGVNVVLWTPGGPTGTFAEGKGYLKRGLVWDYLEVRNVEGYEIEPTLTVNLCFNNRFYFGWLPLLAVLTACVGSFIWKKIRQGKKADTPKFKI